MLGLSGAGISCASIALLVATFSAANVAKAQTYTVTAISSSDLGVVAAAASGTTTFRASPSTGHVLRIAGNGQRLGSTPVRSLVTVTCDRKSQCDKEMPVVTITQGGGPTKRANALQNFTVSTSGTTASIISPPGTGNTIRFTLEPIGESQSKTFYVGYDFPISGDDSGEATGLSTAHFLVSIAEDKGDTSTELGTVQAVVYRTLSVSTIANLSFGRVSRPRSGTGSALLAPSGGPVTVTGDGVVALPSPLPAAARFGISGEGGQSISVTVPNTFEMQGPDGAILVTTISSSNGSEVLPGSLGSSGSLVVDVGGAFPLTGSMSLGAYSGTFSTVVQYN